MNRYTKPSHNRITTPGERRKRLKQHKEMKRYSTISTLIFVDEICFPNHAEIIAKMQRDREALNTNPFTKAGE